MRRFGLIGYPLSHSFSKKFFSEKFKKENTLDCAYENFPISEISQFPELLQQYPDLQGINVTIPYKKAIIPYLSSISAVVEAIGASNCIQIKEGALIGHNTDVVGFRQSLLPFLQSHHQQALILGTGGASAAVVYVLKQLNISYLLVSRSPGQDTIAYQDLTKSILAQHTLIINTTPLGTFPQVAVCPPIPYDQLTPLHHLYDLVYNPAETRFIKMGKEKGASFQNGWEMLIEQANESWRIWNS
jgi:shikimate dehydrogenase